MLNNAIKTFTALAIVLGWFLTCGPTVHAQATGFTYQGHLTDGGSPAMGQYDLTFALFRAPAGGAQIGGELMRQDVQVDNGVFSVDLDFGSSPFTSPAGTHLEIAVRAGASTGAYTALLPRKPITNSPYAVQTIRATSGTVAAAGDALQELSGTRTPARSGNDVQRITDERSTVDVSGGRGLWASRGRLPDVFAAPAWPATRRAPARAALDFGLGTLRATERSGQPTPGEYRIHVITPFHGLRVQTDAVGADVASFGGIGNFRIDAPGIVGGRFAVKESGNVGIGTDSPLAKLDLLGGAFSNGANDPRAMAFQFAGGGYRHWIRTRHNSVLGSGNAIDFFVNDSTSPGGSSGPGLGSGSAHVMTLDSGRVGIGTTDPTEKLTVAGTVQSTSGGFKFPDGSVQATAAITAAANTTFTKVRDSSSPIEIIGGGGGGGWSSVALMTVPGGVYLVSATVEFRNNANFFAQNNTRRVSCGPSGGSEIYSSDLLGLSRLTSTFQWIATTSAGQTNNISIFCNHNGDFTNQVQAAATRITAVKIEGSVVVQ